MSAGLPAPKCIAVHGMIMDSEGKKMSKSIGNVIDPQETLNGVPPDTLRWYLCREVNYGNDMKFSYSSMNDMHNADLCDNLGNLVNRAVNLCKGAIPKVRDEDEKVLGLPFDLEKLKTDFKKAIIE